MRRVKLRYNISVSSEKQLLHTLPLPRELQIPEQRLHPGSTPVLPGRRALRRRNPARVPPALIHILFLFIEQRKQLLNRRALRRSLHESKRHTVKLTAPVHAKSDKISPDKHLERRVAYISERRSG